MTGVRDPEFASPGELDLPVGYGLDNPDRLEWLRTETRDRFRLDIWNTGEHREGKAQLAYRLCCEQPGQGGQVWLIVFAGEEFFPGLGLALDDDQVLADILGFLSLKPGDIEDDYFTRHEYTLWQIAFAEASGEELSIWSADLEGMND